MATTSVILSSEWIEDASDYTAHNCNPKMQLALCVHALAHEAQGLSLTDYTNDFEGLIAASDALSSYMNPDQLRAAEVSIRYINAANNGGTITATIGDKLEEAKNLLHYDEDRLMRAKLYLIGLLGDKQP
jgi:hypothetical protein